MNDTNTQITEEFEKSDDLNVNDSSVIIQNDTNQQNNLSIKKRKRLSVKWIVLSVLAIITGAIAIYMTISFGRVYIKEQKELKADIIEMTNNVIVPDYIPNSTWEDKKAIAEMMQTEDTSQWGQEFLKKVYENTTEEKNYLFHEYMYIPLPFKYVMDPRTRVDLYLDVNNNIAHGTLQLDTYVPSRDLEDMGQTEECLKREYEIYRELRNGKPVTYVKNGEQWYVYKSNYECKNVTMTPKDAAEMYTSEQVRAIDYAMRTDSGMATSIAVDSVVPKYLHQFIHPSYYDNMMAVFTYDDYSLRAVNALSLKLNTKKLKETYGNDKIIDAISKNGTLIHNSCGVEFDKYGQIEEIKIPQNVIDSAIEIESFDFIYSYIFEELDFPYFLDENGDLVKEEN